MPKVPDEEGSALRSQLTWQKVCKNAQVSRMPRFLLRLKNVVAE